MRGDFFSSFCGTWPHDWPHDWHRWITGVRGARVASLSVLLPIHDLILLAQITMSTSLGRLISLSDVYTYRASSSYMIASPGDSIQATLMHHDLMKAGHS
ncbi:hypothetical protein BDP27DRAFT_1335146 [Rhodocollybia butyracea]|uniref:Uncharacterized protein n=1 Tax=Rhodocollybia butyracea TaxID=206335 RepID=A0A9P5U2H7_9AGAR|nr:hypothetical protein BDP27DRAFT_1335146 [Rhodocollybia butyracea]